MFLFFLGGSEIINLSLFSENLTPPPFFSLYLSTLVDSLSLSLHASEAREGPREEVARGAPPPRPPRSLPRPPRSLRSLPRSPPPLDPPPPPLRPEPPAAAAAASLEWNGLRSTIDTRCVPSIVGGLAMHSLTERGSSNSRKAWEVAPAPARDDDSGAGLEGRIATFLILPNSANAARTDASVAAAGIPRTMTVLVAGGSFSCTAAAARERGAGEEAEVGAAEEESRWAATGVAGAAAVAVAAAASEAEAGEEEDGAFLAAVAACGG